MKLKNVMIVVKDIERSKQFYKKLFGLDVVLEQGLIVISAGENVLRLVPPLVITEEDIDEMVEKLEKSL